MGGLYLLTTGGVKMYPVANGAVPVNRMESTAGAPLVNSLEASSNQARLLMDAISALEGRLSMVLGEPSVPPGVPATASAVPTRETMVTRVDEIGRSIAHAEFRIGDIASRLLL